MAFEGWIKWSQSIYPSKAIIGSGLDAIQGNIKSDIKFQVFFGW
jgi:hypothetical protein